MLTICEPLKERICVGAMVVCIDIVVSIPPNSKLVVMVLRVGTNCVKATIEVVACIVESAAIVLVIKDDEAVHTSQLLVKSKQNWSQTLKSSILYAMF